VKNVDFVKAVGIVLNMDARRNLISMGKIIGQCSNCKRIIFSNDNLTYGCPNCECRLIEEYTGIIGENLKEDSYTP